jgi:glycosyltransferase involved in cell wall biosynthesis
MLAHNESANIARTIRSLASQTIFHGAAADLGIERIEVVVVPNGCTDDTAHVATRVIGEGDTGGQWSVRHLPEPGKSMAWNQFVHQLSSTDASFLVLVDADIEFRSADVIEKLVRKLLADPAAIVATDVPIKDYRLSPQLSAQQRLSLAASAQRVADHAICGQLYCARAEVVRRIWLPPHLPVEDGFISAMIKTDGFTRQPIEETVSRVRDASHYYETFSGLSGFLKHESRIIVGSVINFWLFDLLWRQGKQGHTGDYIKARNDADPTWLDQLISERSASKRWWLIPSHFVFWRLHPLRHQPLHKAVLRAPIALATTIVALAACVRANSILRRRGAASFW